MVRKLCGPHLARAALGPGPEAVVRTRCPHVAGALQLSLKTPGFAECSLCNCYSANICTKWFDFRFFAHSGILALACFLGSWFSWLRRLEEKSHRAGHLWEVPLLQLTFWCLQAVLGVWPHHLSPPLTLCHFCVSLCMPLDLGPRAFSTIVPLP